MKAITEIQLMLDHDVNPMLGKHGGRVDVSSIDRSATNQTGAHIAIAYVRMSGGCHGCAGIKYTLNMMISHKITEFDPTIDHIVDITDHSDKSNAYYKG